MVTINEEIGSFVISLGMDGKQLEDGIKKAESTVSGFAKHIGRSILAIGAFQLTKGVVNQFLDSADAIGLLSGKLDISVESIGAWSSAVERAGGDSNAFRGTLEGVSKSLFEMKKYGTTAIAGEMFRFGVSGAKNSEDFLLRVSEKMKGMSAIQAFDMGKKLGIDDGTITILSRGSKAVSELIDKQKQLGIYSEKDAELARKMKESLHDLGVAGKSLGGVFTKMILPALKWFSDALMKVVIFLRDHESFLYGIFIGLAVVLGTILMPTVIRLGVALATAFLPITLIGMLIAGLALLIDDLWVTIQGGDSVINRYFPEFAKLLRELYPVVRDFGVLVWKIFVDGLGRAFDIVKTVIKATVGAITSAISLLRDTFNGFFEWISEKWDMVVGIAGKVKDFFPSFGNSQEAGSLALQAVPVGSSNIQEWKQVTSTTSIGNININDSGNPQETGRAVIDILEGTNTAQSIATQANTGQF